MRGCAIASPMALWDTKTQTSQMSSRSEPGNASSPPLAGFGRGLVAAFTSVFVMVLLGTYVGIGALAHDLGFGLGWTVAATVLIWAAPTQVILISALGSGASPIEAALAVSISGVRLLPMVVALVPLIKGPRVRSWRLLAPAHFTAISVWVEALRLLPAVPRESRIGFINGLGFGLVLPTLVGTIVGFHLAAQLPPTFSAALLFLTPLSFLVSVARNSRHLVDRLSLVFGLTIGPALALADVPFDLLWTGLVGGTLAYGIDRLIKAVR
jgi:predicted branched-subunit amino acid permease